MTDTSTPSPEPEGLETTASEREVLYRRASSMSHEKALSVVDPQLLLAIIRDFNRLLARPDADSIRRQERERIVTWVRAQAANTMSAHIDALADAIERNDHAGIANG